MTTALGHLGQILRYAASRRDHDRHDRDAVTELAVAPAELGLPPGVELRWLGVAGFALTCEGTTILLDPYVTRHTFGQFARRTVLASDPELVDRFIPRADAILLGHTHFDHALDAPTVAIRDGAPVYGGASAAHLMALHGRPDLAVPVEAHRAYEVGPFTIRFVPSEHSKLALGLAVPSDGEITCDHVEHLTPQAYCCGQVWGIRVEVGGVALYHQGSANLIDDEVRHGAVDVFLCGVAGRQFTPDYMARILPRLDPATVVVTHHDDFFRPLGTEQGYAFGVDVTAVPDEVGAVTRDARVVTLPGPTPLP